MELSMSMYATSFDYWQHYEELLAQTMNETAAALGVEPDNEKMLEAVEALRKDAERYRYYRARAYKDGGTLAIDVAVIDDVAIGDFGEFIDATADAAIAAER